MAEELNEASLEAINFSIHCHRAVKAVNKYLRHGAEVPDMDKIGRGIVYNNKHDLEVELWSCLISHSFTRID